MDSSAKLSQNDNEVIELVLHLEDIQTRYSEDEEDVLSQVQTWIKSKDSADLFSKNISGVVISALEDQIALSSQILELEEFNSDDTVAAWLTVLMGHINIVNKTTSLAISEAIARGIREGSTFEQIVMHIGQIFDRALNGRTALIARSMVMSAMNFGAYSVYRFAGIPYKSWNSLLDGLERTTHNVAHGQLVKLGTYFTVGGAQLMYPGDPSGPPEEVINCRCFILPEFREGETVWKDGAMQAYIDSHLYRHTMRSDMLEDSVGIAFIEQKAQVLNILNKAR